MVSHCSDSQRVQNLIWIAANAYSKYDFDCKMLELFNLSPQVHSYLLALPYKWSRSDFLADIRNNSNTNNLSESFNSWIGDARNKPVVDLIDIIRAKLMEQRAERKLNSSAWSGELVPYAEDYLREISTRKEQCIIRQSAPHTAEVQEHFGRQKVDIEARICSCRVWQVSGLPCFHAAAFLGTKEFPLWHRYVDECYSVVRYKMAYEGAISTMVDKNQWTVINDDVVVGVPRSLRPRGRPKKRRIKNFMELNGKRSKTVHKCGRCGQWGHHKTTCKSPLGEISGTVDGIEETTNTTGHKSKLLVRRV